MNLSCVIERSVRLVPDKLAIVDEVTGVGVTYHDLVHRVDILSEQIYSHFQNQQQRKNSNDRLQFQSNARVGNSFRCRFMLFCVC